MRQASGNGNGLNNWKAGTDPCSNPGWAGVRHLVWCDGSGAVVTLDLGYDDAAKGLTGHIAALAPLTALTYLDLGGTAVAGDVSGLAPLTALTHLDLGNTAVTGDVSTLAPLKALTELVLALNLKLTGAASSLDPLTKLTCLLLYGTAVTGCPAFCAAHNAIGDCECP